MKNTSSQPTADTATAESTLVGTCGTASCGVETRAGSMERRGVPWLVVSFLFCPCHLPITLWLAGFLLAGTALGAAMHRHPVVAGAVVTLAWVAGTWRGFRLLRLAHTRAARAESVHRPGSGATR